MLKPKELQILKLLADGHNYQETARQLAIHPSAVYLACQQIRQKTGIQSTKSFLQCKAWLDANPDPYKGKALPSGQQPTAKQLRAMELFAVHKKTLEYIAWEMGISKQGAENHLTLGMTRARIKPRDFTGDRRKEIIAFLDQQPVAMDDPAFS